MWCKLRGLEREEYSLRSVPPYATIPTSLQFVTRVISFSFSLFVISTLSIVPRIFFIFTRDEGGRDIACDGACRGDETHWYRGVGKKNSKEQRNLGRSECRNCHRKDRPTDVASQPFTLPPFVLRENNFLRWAYDCYVVSGWEWILLVLIAREWFLRVKARTVVKISVNPLAKI